VAAALERIMPAGVPPLALFRTLAVNERVFLRVMAGGLLDRGSITLREREIVIDRTCARCGSEYEWGVHATSFGPRAQVTPEELASLVHGGPDDPGWERDARALLRLCDSLHASCDVDDALWGELRAHFSEEAILELLLLAGFYRTVSTLTAVLRLPLEPFAERFPAASPARGAELLPVDQSNRSHG
jgi:alkylhydroperoxidase family enzyme